MSQRIFLYHRHHQQHSVFDSVGLRLCKRDIRCPDFNYPFTIRVNPAEGGSKFAVLYGTSSVSLSPELLAMYQPFAEETVKTFAEIAEEEIATGREAPQAERLF